MVCAPRFSPCVKKPIIFLSGGFFQIRKDILSQADFMAGNFPYKNAIISDIEPVRGQK